MSHGLDGKLNLAVVIPTLNRPQRLKQILGDIQKQTVKPTRIFVIDSSPTVSAVDVSDLNIEIVQTKIKSAAVQRNIGIDLISNSVEVFDFVGFLDDDVRIESDYFELLIQFLRDKAAVGVSGVALPLPKERQHSESLLRRIGISGNGGSVTSAAINLPIRSLIAPQKVQWLMGCSLWDSRILDFVRFESDFLGSSIFEDVLFSIRAGKRGELWVCPTVKIQHNLAQENRPSDFRFYREWCRNRFRLKDVEPKMFSQSAYCVSNFLIALRLLLKGRPSGALGVFWGMMDVYLA